MPNKNSWQAKVLVFGSILTITLCVLASMSLLLDKNYFELATIWLLVWLAWIQTKSIFGD